MMVVELVLIAKGFVGEMCDVARNSVVEGNAVVPVEALALPVGEVESVAGLEE